MFQLPSQKNRFLAIILFLCLVFFPTLAYANSMPIGGGGAVFVILLLILAIPATIAVIVLSLILTFRKFSYPLTSGMQKISLFSIVGGVFLLIIGILALILLRNGVNVQGVSLGGVEDKGSKDGGISPAIWASTASRT